jgi:hypothetical protein
MNAARHLIEPFDRFTVGAGAGRGGSERCKHQKDTERARAKPFNVSQKSHR